jgi:hypothetical protein
MSRSYLLQISGEIRSPADKDELWIIFHRFVPMSQILKIDFGWQNKLQEMEFVAWIEIGANGGDNAWDKVRNTIVHKLNCRAVRDYEIKIIDLHPDKSQYIKKEEVVKDMCLTGTVLKNDEFLICTCCDESLRGDEHDTAYINKDGNYPRDEHDTQFQLCETCYKSYFGKHQEEE